MQIIKQHYKKLIYLVYCLILTCFHPLNVFTSDSYFMVAQGKDIWENGFNRATDIFSVHNFVFMHQKWLMCLETYFVYKLFGNAGFVAMSFILFFVSIVFLAVILEHFLPDRLWLNFAILLISAYVLSFYSTYRPHAISFMFLALFLGVLEQYVNDNLHPWTYYVVFGVISLVIMWYHSTLWVFIIIFWLPYFCDVSWLYKHNKLDLLKVLGAVLIGSLLQPNGIYQYGYMWTCLSASSPDYRLLVGEVNSYPLSWPNRGIYVLIVIYIALCIKYHIRNLRSLYMVFGALLLSLGAYRLNVYSVLLIVFAIGVSCQSVDYYSYHSQGQNIILTLVVVMSLLWGTYVAKSTYNVDFYNQYVRDKIGMDVIDTLVTMVDDVSSTKLCCVPADTGSYAIAQGFPVYFDCRAEVYDIAINHQKDVLSEYHQIISGHYYTNFEDTFILDFQNEYDFDYYVIRKDSTHMIESLMKYSYCIYDDGNYYIFTFDEV